MKKIIVMGASSGIGYRVAEALASRGVRIGVAARRTGPLEELAAKYPGMVEFASIDITKPEAVGQLGELAGRLGGMDIYIHVAGIGYENLDLDPEREVRIVETNAGGFARMLSAAYRWMRDNGVRGRIAAVTSVAGTKGMGRLSAYSSSKRFAQTYITALEQLSVAEKSGIRFTDIRPGWIKTPLLLDGHKYPMEMTLDYALPIILRAIAKGERVAYIDWRWGLLAAAWSRIPDPVWVRMNPPVSTPEQPLPTRVSELVTEAEEKESAKIEPAKE